MSFLGPLLGGISSLFGGAAGATNTRPPAMSQLQTSSLNQLLPMLLQQYSGSGNPLNQPTPQIDPVQQALMYGNIAQGQTGAANSATNLLVSRGLGHSGLLGDALTQVANQAQQGRNQADLGLQQQAVQLGQQNKQLGLQQQGMTLQSLLGLINTTATPGQSGAGGFFAGMAPLLAYSIQNSLNNRQPGTSGGGGGTFDNGANSGGTILGS